MQPDDVAVDAVVWSMWQDAMARAPDVDFVWALTLVDVERPADLYARGPEDRMAAVLEALRARSWRRTADRVEEAIASRHALAAALTIAKTRARRRSGAS